MPRLGEIGWKSVSVSAMAGSPRKRGEASCSTFLGSCEGRKSFVLETRTLTRAEIPTQSPRLDEKRDGTAASRREGKCKSICRRCRYSRAGEFSA